MRLLLTLVGLAIGFAVPALAQDKTRSIHKSVRRLKRHN